MCRSQCKKTLLEVLASPAAIGVWSIKLEHVRTLSVARGCVRSAGAGALSFSGESKDPIVSCEGFSNQKHGETNLKKHEKNTQVDIEFQICSLANSLKKPSNDGTAKVSSATPTSFFTVPPVLGLLRTKLPAPSSCHSRGLCPLSCLPTGKSYSR